MKMPDRNMIFHPAFIMLQLITPYYLPHCLIVIQDSIPAILDKCKS